MYHFRKAKMPLYAILSPNAHKETRVVPLTINCGFVLNMNDFFLISRITFMNILVLLIRILKTFDIYFLNKIDRYKLQP